MLALGIKVATGVMLPALLGLAACEKAPRSKAVQGAVTTPAPPKVAPDVVQACVAPVKAWAAKTAECEKSPKTIVVNGHTLPVPCPPMSPELMQQTACPDLYDQAACGAAWTKFSSPEALQGSPYEGIVTACAAAYCSQLPAPKPAVCGANPEIDVDTLQALDKAILLHRGLAVADADALSQRRDKYADIVNATKAPEPEANAEGVK